MFYNLEKLAEAQRKYETLKSGLKESNILLSGFKGDRKRKKSLEEEDEDNDEETNQEATKNEESIENSKLGLLRDKVVSGNKKLMANVIESADAAQTFTQRIVEKNKQRQLKNQKYKKEHDLKLAFSEFYLSLILLQNYQTLNNTGFRKILKKHDKVFMIK